MKTLRPGARCARVILLALGVTACAGVSHPNPDQLTPYRDRITDEARASDNALLERWEARLVALDGAAVDQIRYGVAEGWLIAAHQQYADNDPSGLAAASLDSARAAILQLEEDHDRHVAVQGLSMPRRDSAGRDLGMSQVATRMAGATASAVAICRAPWYRAWSDTLIVRARQLMLPTAIITPARAPAAPSLAIMPRASAPSAPAAMPTASEVAVVAHGVHFAVNSWAISESSRPELNRLAMLLVHYVGVRAELHGSADPRGVAEHNLMLSQHRADAVRDYLVGAGVPRGRVLVGYRAIAAASSDATLEKYAEDRVVEITLVGADGLPIRLEQQDRDLQVEQARPHVAPVTTPTVRKRATPGTANHTGAGSRTHAPASTQTGSGVGAAAGSTPSGATPPPSGSSPPQH